ncbi:MAG: hypothetical protein ACLTR8_06745 [Oscillospiraceae bacterium]
MFGKMKNAPVPTYDVTQKIKKTWWGGTKLILTTKSEQRKRKAEILKQNPNAIILDSKAKKEKELEWIDRIEDFDAFM